MRALNYWEQFLSTGRIGDYLSYRENISAGEESFDEDEGIKGFKEDGKEGRSEGINQCYRNDIEDGTRGGV